MPLIKLLLLLLLLLRTALLHRWRRPHQWMRLLGWRSRLLRLRWTEFAVHRLRIAILLRLRVPVLWLRSSLLLVRSRLRRLHRPDLTISAIRRSEGFKSFLRLLRPLICRRRLRGSHWADQ
jgi:hypothetical protein